MLKKPLFILSLVIGCCTALLPIAKADTILNTNLVNANLEDVDPGSIGGENLLTLTYQMCSIDSKGVEECDSPVTIGFPNGVWPEEFVVTSNRSALGQPLVTKVISATIADEDASSDYYHDSCSQTASSGEQVQAALYFKAVNHAVICSKSH